MSCFYQDEIPLALGSLLMEVLIGEYSISAAITGANYKMTDRDS